MVGLILIIILSLPIQDTITATTYKLTAAENGPYGNNLASGFKASYKHPGLNRVIAVSPDLLKQYPFHSYVIVKGASKFNGVWRVEDVMNKRYTKRIDLLIDWKTKHNKFNNVTIKHYDHIKTIIRHRKRRVSTIHNVRAKQNHHKAKSRNKHTENIKWNR
jgi:3D (Asp-Asp-Asp) domain-containing protein